MFYQNTYFFCLSSEKKLLAHSGNYALTFKNEKFFNLINIPFSKVIN